MVFKTPTATPGLEPPAETRRGQVRCSACGEPFVCGQRAGTPCWCAALPPLPDPAPGEDCLCRACLARRLARSEHVAR
jgi:hypothetical protein